MQLSRIPKLDCQCHSDTNQCHLDTNDGNKDDESPANLTARINQLTKTSVLLERLIYWRVGKINAHYGVKVFSQQINRIHSFSMNVMLSRASNADNREDMILLLVQIVALMEDAVAIQSRELESYKRIYHQYLGYPVATKPTA